MMGFLYLVALGAASLMHSFMLITRRSGKSTALLLGFLCALPTLLTLIFGFVAFIMLCYLPTRLRPLLRFLKSRCAAFKGKFSCFKSN